MGRHALGAALVVILLASVLLGRPGVVVTQSGQHFEGDIKEQPGSVTISANGIAATVDRDDIASLVYSDDVGQLYQQKLARLGPRDVKGRIALAQWAVQQDRSDLALDALHKAMRIDPNNRQAYDFIHLIRQQRALNATSRPATTNTTAAAAATTSSASAPQRRLLSQEDINRIRQMELQWNDTGVRVRIDNDIRRQYVHRAGITFRQFDDMTPAQKALSILKDGDRQWRNGVRVMNDPPSMIIYKRAIQPSILAGCAASGCHGNQVRGGFILYTRPVNNQASYTNFYILTQYAHTLGDSDQPTGAFEGPARRRMLNRVRPDESILAQYGLPRGAAVHSHPDVPGFQPIYRNRQAPRYQELMTWLSRTLVNIQPDYGITDFPLPEDASATRPSTTAAVPRPTTRPAAGQASATRPAPAFSNRPAILTTQPEP